jgi:hypothetical protein
LAEKEVGIADTKADLAAGVSDIAVTERLKSREEEWSWPWKMGNCESNVRDGHYVLAVRKEEKMSQVYVTQGIEE